MTDYSTSIYLSETHKGKPVLHTEMGDLLTVVSTSGPYFMEVKSDGLLGLEAPGNVQSLGIETLRPGILLPLQDEARKHRVLSGQGG